MQKKKKKRKKERKRKVIARFLRYTLTQLTNEIKPCRVNVK